MARVADYLQEFSSLTVEIQGHTDNIGKPDYNMDLSLRRAKAVIAWNPTSGEVRSGQLPDLIFLDFANPEITVFALGRLEHQKGIKILLTGIDTPQGYGPKYAENLIPSNPI